MPLSILWLLVPVLAAAVWSWRSQSAWAKRVKYEASLQYTVWTQDEWYSEIVPNMWLGALPLNEQHHLVELGQLGITTVVSLVEAFEKQRGWAWTPVDDEQWLTHGVQVINVEAVDFEPLTQANLADAVTALRDAMQRERRVYVHCKAGRGRSASVVIAYLMLEHGLSFAKAHDHVRLRRPSINVNAYQRVAVIEYVSSMWAKERVYAQ